MRKFNFGKEIIIFLFNIVVKQQEELKYLKLTK